VSLEGKVVLVTGGSSGIGRAIATAAARAGADVALTYRGNAAGAEATAEEIRSAGRRTEVLRADVSREADVTGLARAMQERFGRVDAWINNAGADILTGAGGTLKRLEKLDLLLAVDLRGTILASWAAVDLMRASGGGVIINMAWDHVSMGLEGENPILYSAAKGGIMSFSKSLARDVAPSIRVNILAPGFIDTAFGQEEASATWRREVEARTPLGRWGVPEDVAGAALFLISDQAAFLTGQMLMVNGGVVM
jgi:3-oxoacyl-[acyl-carrier protein] reductase